MKWSTFYRLLAAMAAVLLYGLISWALDQLGVIEDNEEVWLLVVAFFAALGGGSLTKTVTAIAEDRGRLAAKPDKPEEGHQ